MNPIFRECFPCNFFPVFLSRYQKCLDNGLRPDLVLSGKKEALRHVGRIKKETLARLQMLAADSQQKADMVAADQDSSR